jgi:hypothetical protein
MSCPLFSVPKKLPTFVHPLFQRITEQHNHNACVADAPVTEVTSVSALFLSATVENFGNTFHPAEAEEFCSRAQPDDEQC